MGIHRFLRMLIGSKKTPLFAFLASSIKFTLGVITPAAAKARSAQGALQFAVGYAAVRL